MISLHKEYACEHKLDLAPDGKPSIYSSLSTRIMQCFSFPEAGRTCCACIQAIHFRSRWENCDGDEPCAPNGRHVCVPWMHPEFLAAVEQPALTARAQASHRRRTVLRSCCRSTRSTGLCSRNDIGGGLDMLEQVCVRPVTTVREIVLFAWRCRRRETEARCSSTMLVPHTTIISL